MVINVQAACFMLIFVHYLQEFERGKRALITMVQTSVKDTISRFSGNKQQTGPLPRVLPWLELFRRAGIALDDESRSRTQRAIESASQLTAWEFMEFFSMPFSDPDLPRRRDILSLFEVAETKEEFLREAFRVLKTPIFVNSRLLLREIASLRLSSRQCYRVSSLFRYGEVHVKFICICLTPRFCFVGAATIEFGYLLVGRYSDKSIY